MIGVRIPGIETRLTSAFAKRSDDDAIDASYDDTDALESDQTIDPTWDDVDLASDHDEDVSDDDIDARANDAAEVPASEDERAPQRRG